MFELPPELGLSLKLDQLPPELMQSQSQVTDLGTPTNTQMPESGIAGLNVVSPQTQSEQNLSLNLPMANETKIEPIESQNIANPDNSVPQTDAIHPTAANAVMESTIPTLPAINIPTTDGSKVEELPTDSGFNIQNSQSNRDMSSLGSKPMDMSKDEFFTNAAADAGISAPNSLASRLEQLEAYAGRASDMRAYGGRNLRTRMGSVRRA
jgi:hypothetical protein